MEVARPPDFGPVLDASVELGSRERHGHLDAGDGLCAGYLADLTGGDSEAVKSLRCHVPHPEVAAVKAPAGSKR